MEPGTKLPRARQDRLVVKRLSEETLIYDLDSHQTHCLNGAAAAVWEQCDGERSATEVARRLHDEFDLPEEEAVVWHAVAGLRDAKLLEEATIANERMASRRQTLVRLGLLGGAVALPLITSVVAPRAVSAQSAIAQACDPGAPVPCPGTLVCCPDITGSTCQPAGSC